MLQSKYILSAVDQYYQGKRSERKFLDGLKEQALEEDKEYSDLKYSLRSLKIDRQHAIFEGDKIKAEKLQKEIDELSLKFENIKKTLKCNAFYDADCPLCGDTGAVNGEICKCYYDRIEAECYSFLSLKNIALRKFSDDTLSVASGHEKEYSAIKRYAEKLPDTDKNILLIGQKGTGKTFLTECLTNSAADKNLCALMISAFSLNELFAKNVTASVPDKITFNEILTTCDLLVIDDLGTEPLYNKITVENLIAIISERLINKKPFVITTNLTLNELSFRYGERAFSRICGKQTVILEMNGKDLRLK